MRRFIVCLPLLVIGIFFLALQSATTQPAPTPTPVSELVLRGDVKTVLVDKVIVVKEQLLLVQSLPFSITAPAGAADYRWTYPATIVAVEKDDVLEITAAPKGPLTISCRLLLVDFDAKKFSRKTLSISFALGEVGPGPKPPDPPIPAPIPLDGFRVLFVVESAANIPADQRIILTSGIVRDYLNKKCADGPRNKEWRQWDKDTDVSGEAAHWQEAMKRKRDSLPWLIISTGKTGYEGPLPRTVADTLALLKKFGGE